MGTRMLRIYSNRFQKVGFFFLVFFVFVFWTTVSYNRPQLICSDNPEPISEVKIIVQSNKTDAQLPRCPIFDPDPFHESVKKYFFDPPRSPPCRPHPTLVHVT